MPVQSRERIIAVNGVGLSVETFGDRADPPVLLIGLTMGTWDDELCDRLAAGPRFVVRYDLRDTGRSTSVDPDSPGYTLRDLVSDAVALLDALDLPRTNVVGFGVGGWIAQLLALDHPGRVASLALISTRPTAPGPNDPDLPEHAPELMAELMSAQLPDWTDPEAVVEFMVAGGRNLAGTGPYDEAEVGRRVRRIADRTADAPPAVVRASHLGTVFAAIDTGDRWRERLGTISAPTLVVHGADDRFFPVGNAEALAREIPGAELLVLPGAGQELPSRTWNTVVPALLSHTT